MACGKGQVLAQFTGKQLEHLQLEHPFLPKHVPVIVGDHVTLEAGTGAVHTAPAHGQEDFVVGLKYSLPVDNPVMGDGRFREGTPFVAGVKVDEANERAHRGAGAARPAAQARTDPPQLSALLAPQDAGDLPRDAAVVREHGPEGPARERVARHREGAVVPAWGEQRIFNMIKDRPDWCLSRQRTWGVPITLFVHKRDAGAASAHAGADRRGRAERVEKDGIEAWFDLDAAELLGADAEHYEKVTDVMDVWADSGLVA